MKPSRSPIAAAFNFSDPDGLTALQGRFLRECAADPAGLTQVAGRIGVQGELLAQWLEQGPFRRRLEVTMRSVKRRREATLALVSSRAADRLAEGVDDENALKADQRRTCVELLKLARAARGKRAARAKEPPITLPDEVSVEEKSQLIERLGGRSDE